eukprot:8863456-Alexandrium_andersonii.AAC.1
MDEAGRTAALVRRVHQVIGESEAGDRHWRHFVTSHRFDLGSPEAVPPLALQHFLDAIDGLGV